MLICDHAHVCDKSCPHRQFHEYTDICAWQGCTYQHPRACVSTTQARLVEFVTWVVKENLVEECRKLLKIKAHHPAPGPVPPPLPVDQPAQRKQRRGRGLSKKEGV